MMAPDTPAVDERVDMYTVQQLADVTGLPPETLKRAIKEGTLKGYYFGTRAGWRVRVDDFIAWRERHSNQPSDADALEMPDAE